MGSLFAAVAAAVFLSSCARGDLSNSYLPAKSSNGPRWSGALAVPMILSDGTIAETAEVAAARAAHLAALEAARASDPDMGRDDGEYEPQKYGDHLYGVEAHSEDLLQSILSYQALAKGGGASAPVYGAPGSGMHSLAKAMSDALEGGAVYGAPDAGAGAAASRSAPAPVYGAPATGAGAAASRAAPAPVYGAPATGAGAAASRAAPAPVYGAPAPGAGEAAASRSAPAPVYGAPATGAGAAASRAAPAPVYGAPATGAGASASRAAPAPVYGAPATGAVGAASRAAPAPVYGAPYQPPTEQSTPYTGPLAMLQLLASGYLADTPEVVAARSTHLKALQEAQAAAELWRASKAATGGNQAHPWS